MSMRQNERNRQKYIVTRTLRTVHRSCHGRRGRGFGVPQWRRSRDGPVWASAVSRDSFQWLIVHKDGIRSEKFTNTYWRCVSSTESLNLASYLVGRVLGEPVVNDGISTLTEEADLGRLEMKKRHLNYDINRIVQTQGNSHVSPCPPFSQESWQWQTFSFGSSWIRWCWEYHTRAPCHEPASDSAEKRNGLGQ